MRWIRSFPKHPPERKSYIVDGMEHWYHDDYDYTGLSEIGEDVCLIEWDIACSQEERHSFEYAASETPFAVRVAPYRLYEGMPEPVWAHRRIYDEGKEMWVHTNQPFCDYFGFGLIYLPLDLIRAFEAAPKETRGTPIGVEPERYTDYRFCDQTFSVWHRRQGFGLVRIDWGVHTVHLNEGKWPQ